MEKVYTERLMIRKFLESDWKDLYEYLSDKEVVKYEPYEVFTEEQTKKEAANRAENKAFYAVCLKDSNKLIGNLYLGKEDFNTFELGYVFNQKYQGNGYATESAKRLLEYAFHELGARRIVAMCNPLNAASWKLLQRLHMRREGRLLQNIYFKRGNDGMPIWTDTYEYGILKDEWLNKNIK